MLLGSPERLSSPHLIHSPAPLSSSRSPGFWVSYSLAFLCNFITFPSLNNVSCLCFRSPCRWKRPRSILLPALPLDIQLAMYRAAVDVRLPAAVCSPSVCVQAVGPGCVEGQECRFPPATEVILRPGNTPGCAPRFTGAGVLRDCP